MNGTTSMPKSVPRLIVDKVRLVPVIQMFPCSECYDKFLTKCEREGERGGSVTIFHFACVGRK